MANESKYPGELQTNNFFLMFYLKKALGYIARKGMRTMKGPIKKKKKNSSMAIFLESQKNSCTQARKLHLQQFY